jgi:hypothetical protein
MFLRCSTRTKDGKTHRYWNVVENRRVSGGRVVQRQVLYLGEINDVQRESWTRTIEVFEDGATHPRTLALFANDRAVESSVGDTVHVRVKEMALYHPRQWGGCWLSMELYRQLGLDEFWAQRLPPNRKGTRWDLILQALCTYRLLDPGSEWRLHRHWYRSTAMADLLGAGFELAEIHKLYECLDKLLPHKRELFAHLTRRWKDLFGAEFEVLLYDLTSTYFEIDPPESETDKRRFGYSRDKRSDCVQVVIALVVTPEGFPLAYEVLSGNTTDKTTLKGFLKTIEDQYGKAKRIWVMDRGVPTEEVLAEMRAHDPPVHYLVGTPKGRLTRYEQTLLDQPWQEVRDDVSVKMVAEGEEVYVLAKSQGRVGKERSMRRRQLKALWKRLHELKAMALKRDQRLLKLGAAQHEWPAANRLVTADVDENGLLSFSLRKDRLRDVRKREGRYLLRSNLVGRDPTEMWSFYMQLVHVEEAFKTLKGDLEIRPIYHQKMDRVEAHIFVAFMAYCLHVTLHRRLRDRAPGLTPRAVLEKFSSVQMLDVHFPTTDGRTLILTRYTQPEKDLDLLLHQLELILPPQPPPKITAKDAAVVKTS